MFGEKSIPAMHLQHSEVTFTVSRYKFRCFATLGEEPEIELAWVIVPKKTENWLHFSAILHDGASEVHYELAFRT
jgi:hypothetical protein